MRLVVKKVGDAGSAKREKGTHLILLHLLALQLARALLPPVLHPLRVPRQLPHHLVLQADQLVCRRLHDDIITHNTPTRYTTNTI